MTELSSLQVFKYLPAAKKLPEGNCKKCKFPTCMAFALKISKGMADVNLCPYIPEELKEKLSKSLKKPQEELLIGQEIKVPIGGETVLYRHDKTFVNKCAMGVVLDCSKKDFANKLKSILDFKINRINDIFKVDFVLLKGKFDNSVGGKPSEGLLREADMLRYFIFRIEDMIPLAKRILRKIKRMMH